MPSLNITPSVSILGQARAYCEANDLDFDEAWAEYASKHYLAIGPDYLFMYHHMKEPVEGWFIYLAIGAGNFKVWHRIVPYRLPNVIYYRAGRKGNKMRVIAMEQIERFL